jgi:predicted dehydrogenase
MTKALVVGLGSIGTRHARILSELRCTVSVVSRRTVEGFDCYPELSEALLRFAPDYVVIANETSAHLATLQNLVQLGYRGMVLLEKPLALQSAALPDHRFRQAALGYNLRFHPVLVGLHEALIGEQIISAQVYCGQYLPDWRPDTDYRNSYSAQKELGGGVLRDLSHEIDYMNWLFGDWRRLAALGGNLGGLEIDSDDCWGVLIEYGRCPVATLHLNYLDRPGRREIVVTTKNHTFKADLKSSSLECDGQVSSLTCQRDDTYRAQHVAMLSGDTSRLCSLAEGMKVMEFFSACETAASTGQWVTR